MTKVCKRCSKILDENKFNWKIKNIKRATYCKECSRKYIRGHYKNNRDYYLEKARKRNSRLRKEAREYMGKYLSTHPCIDCGETDIVVLEFDHKIKSRKYDTVSRIIHTTGSIEKLKKEISKCSVRCANCHRRKTYKESKSWRLLYAPVA